ncbi:MAG: VIT domain-containing protein [Phycisphaerae bacterium]
MQLPLRRHAVDAKIVDAVAVTSIEQVFFNPYNAPVEGTYIFPLPDDVALSGFSMYIDGREIEGKLLGVEEARRVYESIVARMRDPALLEYIGSRMFRARIFPIQPKAEARVRLSYTQLLTTDDGLVRYRYPLKTDRGSAPPIELVSVVVNVSSATPIKSVFSPSHAVAVSRNGDHKASVSFEGKNVRADKDFELLYTLSNKEFGLSVLTFRDAGQDGFFLVRIAPPAHTSAGDVLPKDISFVIDASGSMSGEKMEQAKNALKFCLENLHPQDRFNIIPFSHEPVPFRPALVDASKETIDDARAFADALKANGGTNIHDALLTALATAPGRDDHRPYLIVFLTDGQPTIGVTDPDDILKAVQNKNARRVRLFVFGVGNDVNTRLLDLLAEQNRGARDYVQPGEDLELTLSSFYRKVTNPVLADLSLSLGGLTVRDMYPPKLGDLFAGTELVVAGRYTGAGSHAVELTGTRRGTTERFVYETTFPSENRTHTFLPRLWATRKVGYLLDQIRLHGETTELKDTIVQLATEYGIVTPYTAYLVTEPGRVAVGGRVINSPMADALQEISYGHQVPASPAASGGGGGSGARPQVRRRARKIRGAKLGAAAVADSEEANALRSAETVDTLLFLGEMLARDEDTESDAGRPMQPVQRVGTRTFYRVQDRWVDAAYDKNDKTSKVELFSEAYFDLVRQHPELAKCFALGDRVVVMLDGIAYETVEPPEQD